MNDIILTIPFDENNMPNKAPIPPDPPGNIWISNGGYWKGIPIYDINDEVQLGKKNYIVKSIRIGYLQESISVSNKHAIVPINPNSSLDSELLNIKLHFCWMFYLESIV